MPLPFASLPTLLLFILTSLILPLLPGAALAETLLKLPALEASEAERIGQRIFANECNLKASCLTSWNAGENFPSLGIGHFIWYRADQTEPFVESFPSLLAFYRQEGIPLPRWLDETEGSPWSSRDSFLAQLDSSRLTELRQFLLDTMDVQVRFIINRLHGSLPLLKAASSQPEAVEAQFYRVAGSGEPGMYALIDYINFKGEGTAESERYAQQGWGLLQVLEHMLTAPPAPVMEQFADSAAFVLERRIRNAPAERGEERWRAGWLKRVDTYRAHQSH